LRKLAMLTAMVIYMARNSGLAPAIYLSGFSYEKLFISDKRKFKKNTFCLLVFVN
jgi:hypothetical protein